MSESGNTNGWNLQSIAPAGSSNLYLLHVNDPNSGDTETAPLQVLLSGYQEIVPPCSTKLIEIPQNLQQYLYINESDRAPITISGQELKQLTSTKRKVTAPEYADNLSENPIPSTSKEKHSEKTNLNNVDKAVNQRINRSKDQTTKGKEVIQSTVHISDQVAPSRAVAVLPTALRLRKNCILPRRLLPPNVRFGPVQGVTSTILPSQAEELILEAAAAKEPIFLIKLDEDTVEHIDVSDKDKSNWMSLLPLGEESTANVWLYQEDNELYGITINPTCQRTTLALGYSKTYAEKHRLPPGLPVLDLAEEALSGKSNRWWCHECHHAVASAALLQRHINVYHKDDKPSRQRRRCSHCSRTFSGLFALKRHRSRFCSKKEEVPSSSTVDTEPKPISQLEASTSQNADDSRIPSDESFQNYTNGLDIPTNLFDTDRIPYLDISGSSKSDVDFDPYLVGLNENITTSLKNNQCDIKVPGTSSKVKLKSEEIILVPCGYCKQSVSKARKRRHLRECPARHFDCECGQKFKNKNALAEHIYTEHMASGHNTADNDSQQESKHPNGVSSNELYKCEYCTKTNFKRRGMLVNHLWRIHKVDPGSVPLVRSKRHYPCSICPKIYCSAAKRDRHVTKYHPESGAIRAAPIESMPRHCDPFFCKACPRQYVTRAKLLQHIRAKHPFLVID